MAGFSEELAAIAAAVDPLMAKLLPDGDGPEGTPCEFATTCNPGTLCVNPDFYPNPACQGSLGCCAPYCDLSDMNACAGASVEGVSCVPYHEPGQAPPELENVGLCGLP